MTREQVHSRQQMALAAGVFSYGDWLDALKLCGWPANMREPTDEENINALNYLLEENNVLTPASL